MTYREKRIESVILPDLPVLSFGTATAWCYGELRAKLEREGTLIGDADMRIAAIAPGLTGSRLSPATNEASGGFWGSK